MKEIVLDASVGLKWFFPEELSREANVLMCQIQNEEIKVIVPEYYFVEFANGCWTKSERKKASTNSVLSAMHKMDRFSFRTYSDVELADVSLENAFIYDISVYDAMYLSLAEIFGWPVVTADQKLVEKCKDRFELIEWLGDL